MRNLKRVLSLALASVMLLGMMAIGASAADTTYSDQSSITKEEAVAVMSAIGVFQGSDGKFSPTGDLTRETAAKIITYMLMGKEAADALVTSGAPFTDVAADRWSAGSIAYCVQNGIVAGDGQGHFFPEMTINGASFAKMLLVALGYNANTEKLVGTGWEVNVAKLAKSAKLTSGLGSSAMSKTLNREESAQMAFNALKANIVEYTGGSSLDLGNGSSITIGGTREKTDDTFNSYYFSTLKANSAKADAFGRPATTWRYGAKTVGTYADTADYIYTAKTDKDDISDEIGNYFTYIDDNDVSQNVNVTVTDTATATHTAAFANVTNATTLAALTKNGRAVEVYISNDKISNVIVIDTYLVNIDTVNTVGKTVSLSAAKDLNTDPVSITNLNKVTNEDDADLYAALAEMGKDAKALVVVAGAKVISVAAPEKITGNYTEKSSSGAYTIGGETYKKSLYGDDSALTARNTTYNVYLDAYGYLMGATTESESDSSYAYLMETERVGSSSNGRTYNAKLLFTDGTQSWEEVSSYGGKSMSDNTTAIQENFLNNTLKNNVQFVTYTVKTDGTYSIKPVAKSSTPAKDLTSKPGVDTTYAFSDAAIVKGASSVFNKVLGSSETIFLVQTSSTSGTYTFYTGVKNVPNLTEASGIVLVSEDTLTANVVVVNSKKNSVDASSLAYIISSDHGSRYDSAVDGDVFTYDAIVAGESVTLTTTVEVDEADRALTAGLYFVDYDSNKYGVSLTAFDSEHDLEAVVAATTVSLSKGTITIAGSDDSYVTADDFVAFLIDTDGDANLISADDVKYYTSQEKAFIILDEDQEFVTTLIIIEKDA
ncbi:MAG TPA: S-layer homology domain-containing protein [Pseudoflavonifractor sp.]|nr:S-layer homology domain-containing protein [Pseudoflavonifractor sp.]